MRFYPHLTVFPNPTAGIINLSTDDADKIVQVSLWTSNGERIFSDTGTVDQLNRGLTERLQGQSKGWYILKVLHDEEEVDIRISMF